MTVNDRLPRRESRSCKPQCLGGSSLRPGRVGSPQLRSGQGKKVVNLDLGHAPVQLIETGFDFVPFANCLVEDSSERHGRAAGSYGGFALPPRQTWQHHQPGKAETGAQK